MDIARPSTTAMTYPRDQTPIDPPYLSPAYHATVLRAPGRPMAILPHTPTEVSEPVLGEGRVQPADADLTTHGSGEPLGERIIVHGYCMRCFAFAYGCRRATGIIRRRRSHGTGEGRRRLLHPDRHRRR